MQCYIKSKFSEKSIGPTMVIFWSQPHDKGKLRLETPDTCWFQNQSHGDLYLSHDFIGR